MSTRRNWEQKKIQRKQTQTFRGMPSTKSTENNVSSDLIHCNGQFGLFRAEKHLCNGKKKKLRSEIIKSCFRASKNKQSMCSSTVHEPGECLAPAGPRHFWAAPRHFTFSEVNVGCKIYERQHIKKLLRPRCAFDVVILA